MPSAPVTQNTLGSTFVKTILYLCREMASQSRGFHSDRTVSEICCLMNRFLSSGCFCTLRLQQGALTGGAQRDKRP